MVTLKLCSATLRARNYNKNNNNTKKKYYSRNVAKKIKLAPRVLAAYLDWDSSQALSGVWEKDFPL